MQRRRRINLQKSGGMSSDVQHGEVPSTSKLSTRTQKRSTHKAQKKMPARTSAGRLECFIKVCNNFKFMVCVNSLKLLLDGMCLHID